MPSSSSYLVLCQRLTSVLKVTPSVTSRSSSSYPEMPQRPMNAYLRYLKEQRETVKRNNPDIKVQQVVKQIASQWSSLSDDQKESYRVAYEKDKEQWQKKKEAVEAHLEKANLLGEMKAKKSQEMVEKAISKANKEKKKIASELGMPKRPVTAFILFSQENNKHSGDLSMVERAKKNGEDWKSLSETQKEVYVKKAKDLHDKYASQVESWTKKMQSSGSIDKIDKITKKIENLKIKKKSIGAAE